MQALPPPHRALLPSLRALLLRASQETDGFMRRSAARLPGAALRRRRFIPVVRCSRKIARAMSPRSRPDTHQLQQMNTLLEAALELPESQREAWLQALPAEQRALAPLLRAMLQRASVETDDFMRQPVGLAPDLVEDAARPTVPATGWGRICCCSSSAPAAWPRSGWPSAPTARCSARWR